MCTGSQFQEALLSHGGIERVREVAIDSMEDFVIDDARKIPGISNLNNLNLALKALQLGVPMESGVGKISD